MEYPKSSLLSSSFAKALNKSHFLPQMRSHTQGAHSITVTSCNVGCREDLVPCLNPLEMPMHWEPRGQSQTHDYGNQITVEASWALHNAPTHTVQRDKLWVQPLNLRVFTPTGSTILPHNKGSHFLPPKQADGRRQFLGG